MEFLCVLKMYHVRLFIVEKMGFGTAPRRYGIHSQPQPLLQKTCLFYASQTLATYVKICLRTHALACIRRSWLTCAGWGPLWSFKFSKIDFCSFKRFYFPFQHSLSQFNIWLGFKLALGLRVWASLRNGGSSRKGYKIQCLQHVAHVGGGLCWWFGSESKEPG